MSLGKVFCAMVVALVCVGGAKGQGSITSVSVGTNGAGVIQLQYQVNVNSGYTWTATNTFAFAVDGGYYMPATVAVLGKGGVYTCNSTTTFALPNGTYIVWARATFKDPTGGSGGPVYFVLDSVPTTVTVTGSAAGQTSGSMSWLTGYPYQDHDEQFHGGWTCVKDAGFGFGGYNSVMVTVAQAGGWIWVGITNPYSLQFAG